MCSYLKYRQQSRRQREILVHPQMHAANGAGDGRSQEPETLTRVPQMVNRNPVICTIAWYLLRCVGGQASQVAASVL